MEETKVIDEAGVSGDCSDEENNSDDGNEAWVLSVEANDKPMNAEFLPIDSACEEHTCPWNFAEGGRDLGPFECAVEKREQSLNSFRQESDGVV